MWECGLKFCQVALSRLSTSHSLCGSVDWNCRIVNIPFTRRCHSLCGSVDWNISTYFYRRYDQLSLPVWECGLKSFPIPAVRLLIMSLPVWECGLKFRYGANGADRITSLPVWECGLKYCDIVGISIYLSHSLCGSVDWNYCAIIQKQRHIVTPCVGVWIEMVSRNAGNHTEIGHSLCGSVDWNNPEMQRIVKYVSHSLCGSVDWNPTSYLNFTTDSGSLPVWECGLKWMENPEMELILQVTPCVGVWIEIFASIRTVGRSWSHSLCGSVDWNLAKRVKYCKKVRHSLCGSVDWNYALNVFIDRYYCHSLCGSVDWNLLQSGRKRVPWVTPCVGVWIEIRSTLIVFITGVSHSLCGSVDWNSASLCSALQHLVTPCVGVWIEISDGRWFIFSSCHSLCGSVDWNI